MGVGVNVDHASPGVYLIDTSHRGAMRRLVLLTLLAPLAVSAQDSLEFTRGVDGIFSRWNASTPGCVVGVARDGRPLLVKGYGMSNLEYGVPLGAGSVMESGSVAKQFTAAAVALLHLDGKLSLDDDIRRHLPEVPDFGSRITIRHLLTHTSGLRDQWGLLVLTGNPPGVQVHTLPLILHLVTRQQELNFPVGSEYLYSNTGYALAAIIVSRVSGQTLADFSRERFFTPLGMTRTQWRDDFKRVVKDRATAYERRPDGTYAQFMPFTNVYGNGGLLATMDDMLRWNEALRTGSIPGGKPLVDLLETRQRLTSGVTVPYALGLRHDTWNGHREVAHSGSTAGYSTYLTRFPDARLSVSVFCNASDANPGMAAHRVAGLLLPPGSPTSSPTAAPASAATPWIGRYRNPSTDDVFEVVTQPQGMFIRMPGGTSPAEAQSDGSFRTTNGYRFSFVGAGETREARVTDEDGVASRFAREETPSGVRLEDYVGAYESPEVGARYTVRMVDGRLRLTFPPAADEFLTPLYHDGFSGRGRTIRFVRDATGRVTEIRVFAGRVRNVKFVRLPGG